MSMSSVIQQQQQQRPSTSDSSSGSSSPRDDSLDQYDESASSPQRVSYAPVQKSVQIVSDRLKSSQSLQSALQLAANYLPTVVTDLSVAGAGRLQELGSTYAQPLVARVDDRISTAVATVQGLPAYGTAKVVAIDEFAFAHTPEVFKPTYTRTKSRAIEVVQNATERVVQLKRQRGEPLYDALTHQLDNVQKRIAQLRHAISELGHNTAATARETLHALRQLDRLTELQKKITEAVEVTRTSLIAKDQQVRAISSDVTRGVIEVATQITAFVESNLTEQQNAALRALWSRLLEAVSTLQETLHITPVRAEESKNEGIPHAQAVAAISASPVAVSASPQESTSNGVSKVSPPTATGANDNSDSIDTSDNSTDVPVASSKKKNKKKRTADQSQEEGQPKDA